MLLGASAAVLAIPSGRPSQLLQPGPETQPPPANTTTPIARYGTCAKLSDASEANFAAFKSQWHPLNDPDLYYFQDRCWSARYACELDMTNGASIQFEAAEEVASGTEVSAGRYLAVIGPATSYGVAASAGFGDQLQEYLNLPVLNLGFGAAGPQDYVGDNEATQREPQLRPLLAQSAAVIVVIMAGRSSPNSAFPDDVYAMDREVQMLEILETDPERYWKLASESLDRAAADYQRLAAQLETDALALGRPRPKIALLWLSDCKLEVGCQGKDGLGKERQFPQYYVDGSERRLRELAASMGAELIDAYHGDATREALPTNLCADCSAPATPDKVCALDEVRAETDNSSSTCTSCAYVLDSYYAPDAGHRNAAMKLRPFALGALGMTVPTQIEAWQQAILNNTNLNREKHCDTTPLAWDAQLAAMAQAYADTCPKQPSMRGSAFRRSSDGEAIAWAQQVTAWTIQGWYDEVNGAPPGGTSYDFSQTVFSPEHGHFTQVVWRATTAMGCGTKVCPGISSGEGDASVLVCQYDPGGNVKGGFQQNVGKLKPDCRVEKN